MTPSDPLLNVPVCSPQIYGHAVACGAAQEMLQSIVASVCSRSVSVSSPGVTRYLLEQEGKTFLSNMEEDYQLCVLVEPQLWEPLAEQVAAGGSFSCCYCWVFFYFYFFIRTFTVQPHLPAGFFTLLCFLLTSPVVFFPLPVSSRLS